MSDEKDLELAKKKAAAAAKAKAAALAKEKRELNGEKSDEQLAKEKAKAIAIAKAKAAAAAKLKAKKIENEEVKKEEVPSKNDPLLNKYVKLLTSQLGNDVLEQFYINKLSKHIPTLIAAREHYFQIAKLLKNDEELAFDYLSEFHGTDFETYMEIYLHLYSFKHKQSVVLKAKLDRDNPRIESVQPLWEGADWPEREAYDLLGIEFISHPNLKRIMLSDDWIGHPLRKDYEEVDDE
ncbi:NADH-quinone oxidoreductase subunit C [Metabacillus fastidiosus]|uniref:NADH-quinone oxidoreductase subunit C n=1 Tax=Metabacillus fastidiosus TaxID=1458 RepID=UPI002E21C8B6|nr:NADH-quinone oxidoreductase subunit C [Metabacillus fastidiosus]MED4456021.1 NADH-quinone oxidoreductase subunit C [Metabacillus fastidiosus]